MKKIAIRILSMCLILIMCLQFLPLRTNAVSYSGSSSYKSGQYYTKLTKVNLTGNQRTDIVNIAKSQVGYQEGSSSSQLSGASYGGKNYTEYGRWYGLQDMWCAMFVSWCANVAGISTSIIPKHAFTPDGLSWFKSRGLAYTRKTVANGGYTPQAGDIIYFKSSRNSNTTNHIGIVTGYSGGTVYTIEGNSSSATISTNGGAVVSKSYSISNTYIVYICKPSYKNSSSSGGTGGGSTGSGSSTLYSGKNNWIPDSVQSIVFNPTYYSNKYADLKNAFGTDGNKLYQHFLDYGAKEGRQASAMFHVNTYLEKNSDLKKAFGTDYKAAIKHFASNGINEVRVTAPAVNLGTSFTAKINVSTATLNLSLSDSDVISYTPSDAAAQVWKFDRQSNGTYKITNTKNGQVLTLAGSSKSAGAKVQIAKSNDSNAQRWYIYESGVSGKYIFRPACSPGIIIGVKGDSASSMAAIQSVKYTNSKGQRFGITKVTQTVTEKPVDLGTNFHARIGSVHASGKNLSLDDNNVILYSSSKAPAQSYRFSRQSDGSYILINQKNGYVLTVAGNGGNGSNVELAKNTGASGQKWFIYEKDGKYTFRPACATGCALNLQGSATADLTNIQIATKSDSNAQLFTITRAVFFDLMDPVDVGTDFIANIKNVNAGLNLSLNDNNVIIFTPSDAAAQKFKFERQSDGSYKIINQQNGYVLEAASNAKGANVQVAKSDNSKEQRWFIYVREGHYIFRPVSSDYVLKTLDGGTELRTRLDINNLSTTKVPLFDITNITQIVPETLVDLGTNFHARISSVHASGKNLSLDDNNVILYGKSKAPAQSWRFSRQSDGSYILINQKNGYVLTVAGNGGNGSNVELAKNTGASGQKWFIYEKDGKYTFRPACATGCALNLQGSATADLTNIQIATKSDSNAQLFTITRAVFFDLMDPVDVGTDFIANIKNVNAGLNLSLNDNNVIIFTPSDAAAQKFKFERQSDGSYKIINQQNGYVLEAASNAKGANVQVAKSDNSKEQRWFIYVREGHYIFRPVSSDYVLKTLDGGTELRTRLDINNLSTTKVPLFDITNITGTNVTYTVASPYNTKSVGTYATLDEAKSVANSKVHYGYVVFDSTGKFVYTPATSLTASKIIWKAKEDADYIRDKGWTYGDAKKNPYLDKSEKVVSCDRFVGWVLGDVGFTSGQPSTAGLNLVALEQFMINNGFTKITDVTKIEAGDIVYVGHFSAPGTANYNIPRHVFISASSYKSGNGTTYRYDAGSNSRIQSTQPSREPLVHEGDVFRYAYRAPASINNSGGSTNPNTLVIPDAIKTLVFDATYYSNAHADLKNAFGTDAAKLYQHFLDYGIKEGRRAHPTFDIKCYLSENPDLKSAFGTDYLKGMKHYIEFGHKEIRVTAPNVDLGHNFVAKIGSVHASGKNLSLDDNNVILYTNSKAPAQAWRFSRQTDGSYIIVNQKTGLVLTAAGNGGSGANVELTKNAKAANQKWFIYAMNDKYSLRPACSTGCALNLQGSATADLTNIQVASKNNVTSQLFTITQGNYFDLVQHADVGTGFIANIKNVKSGLNLSLNDNNVIIYTPSDAAAQKYKFERQSDGSYKLINQKNGYVLEVASSANGANVQIAESDNTSDQRWFIYVKEGHYIFRPASSKNYVLKTCDDGTDPLTRLNIKSLSHNGVPQFDINHCQASSPSSGSGNEYATAEQMAVLRKIMYAVETGGQVYGNARYDDFTEAYTNTPEEHAITIGAGQWYGPEAKKLLNTIRSKYPSTFASLDTAGIASDLDNCDWSTYKLSASSAKAKCIVKIINTPEGRAVQDQLIDEQMAKYLEEARSLGVTEIKAMMMCANLRHLGGLSAVKRVLGKTETPYTLDHIYEALQTDTGNQVGAFRSRNQKVYNWLLQYIG